MSDRTRAKLEKSMLCDPGARILWRTRGDFKAVSGRSLEGLVRALDWAPRGKPRGKRKERKAGHSEPGNGLS